MVHDLMMQLVHAAGQAEYWGEDVWHKQVQSVKVCTPGKPG